MCLQRLVIAIRRRLNPPREIARVRLPFGPDKPVEARIESGFRESGDEFETFHFETWKEGFTPDQLPLVITLCVKLAERFYRDASLSEQVRRNLWLLLRAYGLEGPPSEEMETGWRH